MQRKSSTEIEPCQARLNLGLHRFEKWNEPCGVDSASTVHPVNGFSLSQCVGNPMFGNTAHALARTPRSAEVVQLACLRLDLGWVNALCAPHKSKVSSHSGAKISIHVNH